METPDMTIVALGLTWIELLTVVAVPLLFVAAVTFGASAGRGDRD